MMRVFVCNIIAAVLFGFAACADMQTIGRRTTLPGSDKTDGVAIHLDAQQRLVLVKAGGHYCAEPSPDALAAYASSLGLGVSAPSQGAASVANALQGSAGSIGLRTQSITLMRDQLYRMCEAYENGSIGQVQVSTLLGRSQDLTAVVLAIEQLTGAVAANQVILSGAAGSGASASLLSDQKLLDEARKNENEKKTSLDDAISARDKLQADVTAKEKDVKIAQEAFDNAKPEDKTALEKELNTKKTDLDKTKSDLVNAKSQVDLKQTLYEDAKKLRETIEAKQDSAVTSANANATGAGQFSSSIVQRNALSKEATESIAEAVQGMVKAVLMKNYNVESCMGFLTTPPPKGQSADDTRQVRALCVELVKGPLSQELTKMEATSVFTPDTSTETIQRALKNDPTLRGRLAIWLADKGYKISVSRLLYGTEYADLRKQAISEFRIESSVK
jgi:hypothetical protein